MAGSLGIGFGAQLGVFRFECGDIGALRLAGLEETTIHCQHQHDKKNDDDNDDERGGELVRAGFGACRRGCRRVCRGCIGFVGFHDGLVGSLGVDGV